MTASIAWIDDRWGQPDQLGVPLSDRGLQLADGLFETVLVEDGEPCLLAQHLARWHGSARLLGMAAPPQRDWLEPLIADAVHHVSLQRGSGALRLNWSRDGAGSRGVSTNGSAAMRFWLSLQTIQPTQQPITAITSQRERRNPLSLLSQCKTFSYGQAIQARREAERNGADEAVLLNTSGELCCGTVANLLVLRQGRWLTPPLSSGCLPGVIRQRGLDLGRLEEAWLGEALQSDDQAVLVNSLGCRPLRSIDGQRLQLSDAGVTLWAQLHR